MTPALAIVGAGPAGVAAALAAREAGLELVLLEAGERPGGQLHRIHAPPSGVSPPAAEGAELAAALARRLDAAGVSRRFGAVATGLSIGPGGDPVVSLAGREPQRARALLIATGARARRLDVPGEREFEGLGVSNSATRDRRGVAGLPVAVVGGGDAAFENALLLAEVGCPVTLLVRGEPRARAEFRSRVEAEPAITIESATRVLAILGDDRVTGVRVAGPAGERVLATRGVFVKAGSEPNTAWCRSVLAADAGGCLRVDAGGATSLTGVWAAGDVTGPVALTIAAAERSGRLAAAAIGRWLAARGAG